MTLHNAFAAQYGSSVLAGLQNIDTQLNAQVQNDVGIGSVFPQFQAITEQKPQLLFASRMIASLLDVTGSTGAVIDDSNTLTAYFASLGPAGLPAAGSVHRTYVINRGLLIPRRLNVSHRQPAQLDVAALCYSADGAAHPIAIADDVALPTLPVANIEHTLGPIKLGISGASKTVECPTSLSIDFGNTAETSGCGSDVFDKHAEQKGIQSVINITGRAATIFGPSGVPAVGLKFDHAGTAMYLRKRAAGIGFVAPSTEEHIKITADGIAVVTQHTGQGTDAAEVTLQMYCGWDGTNAPLNIDTSSAIT